MVDYGGGPKIVPLSVRFWAQVNKTDTCWEWTSKTVVGYGVIKLTPSFRGEKVKRQGAHRVSWELHNGPIPDGLWVLHRCDNRRCVNPDHLFLGTHGDNMRDMVEKKRSKGAPPGEAHHFAKMKQSEVDEARALYDQGWKYKDIAKRYGVTAHTISRIARRVTWRG